jgi:hypothetical protein
MCCAGILVIQATQVKIQELGFMMSSLAYHATKASLWGAKHGLILGWLSLRHLGRYVELQTIWPLTFLHALCATTIMAMKVSMCFSLQIQALFIQEMKV